MRFLIRTNRSVIASACLTCLISACGVVPTDTVVARAGVQGLRTDTPTSVVVSQSPPNTAARTLARLSRTERAAFRRWVLHVELAAFYAHLHAVWLAAWESIPPQLVPTENCIKSIESGDYDESSHPGSGSGAFQMIPSTFAAYFARWVAASGYSGPFYVLAYQAPPGVQDGVLVFMLTHGGASNYSGVDGCTGY